MSKTVHHELTRKEMKGPDKFQATAAEAAEWAGKRQKQLALVVGAAAVAVVLAVAISSWMQARRNAAGAALYQAIGAASGEVSSIPLPGVDRPLYKTPQEKQQAVLGAAEKVRQEHGGSRAAATAALLAGDAQLAAGTFDQAAQSFQAYLDKADRDDPLRYNALDGLARAQEGKGDLAAAAKTYGDAAGLEAFKDRANLEKARVLAKAGQKAEAEKALQAVPKESPLSVEAQERLARLGGK